MGRWQGKINNKERPTVEPRRQGFHEIEQIDIAEGWRQIVAGEWRGIGLLDVQEDQDVWGRRIIIADAGANRGKLQAHYPGVAIFTPEEFRDAVENWPDDAATIRAKRLFQGDIQGVA